MVTKYSHKEHFELLKSWFDDRRQFGLERWMLPDIGLVVDDEAIAFLVTTNSPIAWIAHWSVDPKLSKKDRDRAIATLTGEMETLAREKGYRLLQTVGKIGFNLSHRLNRHGFSAAEGEFTLFVKEI